MPDGTAFSSFHVLDHKNIDAWSSRDGTNVIDFICIVLPYLSVLCLMKGIWCIVDGFRGDVPGRTVLSEGLGRSSIMDRL